MVISTQTARLRLTQPCIGAEEVEAVKRVLESGWLTEGPETRRLERRVASYVGAQHAVAVCNCTVALELCLRAMNIKGGVVIPDFTHPATAQAIINAGATPILCDVDLDSYNLNRDELTIAQAVMPVSWAGNPLTYWFHDIPVIEDAACSLGAEYDGVKTGAQHTAEDQVYVACFSFHPRKLITCGEGGIITTNDEALAIKIRTLKNFGEDPTVLTSQKWNGKYDYVRWCQGQVDFTNRGGNYKLSDIHAAVALAQMDKLDQIIERRINMARIYDELLSNVQGVKAPEKHDGAKHTYQTYAVYLGRGNRDQIIQKLAEKGIEAQIGSYALHLLTAFKHLKRVGSLANAEKLHANLLALPMAYDLTPDDQQYVVDELKNAM